MLKIGKHRTLRRMATRCAATAALAVACDDSTRPAPTFSIRDSSGITIVENLVPSGDTTGWWIDTVPVTTIGDEKRGDGHIFSWITDAALLSRGDVVVSDGRQNQVKLFDSTGTFVRDIGRSGQGPGEYRGPYQVFVLAGDTVMIRSVYDGASATVFTRDGAFVRSVAPPDFRTADSLRRKYSSGSIVGVFEDGSLLASAYEITGQPPGSARPGVAELTERRSRLMRALAGKVAATEFGEHVLSRYYRYHNPDPRGAGAIYNNPTLVAQPRYATQGKHFYLTDAAIAEVRIYSPEGVLHRVVRHAAAAATWPKGWADSVWRNYQEIIGGSPDASWIATVEPPPLPDAPPAIDALLVSSDGSIWTRRPALAAAVDPLWSVFDSTGVLRYALRWRGEIKRVVGDRILSVATDSTGAQFVTVHRIRLRR